MTALRKIVIFCVVAIAWCQDICPRENPADPFADIDKDARAYPYPEKEISLALQRDPQRREEILNAAAEAEAASKLLLIPATLQVDNLCKSKFVTLFSKGWSYLGGNGRRCWVLSNWWTTAISYVTCPFQTCQNLPCFSKRHYCVPTNYKVFGAWSWCQWSGFQYRKFNLPQCCECKRFFC